MRRFFIILPLLLLPVRLFSGDVEIIQPEFAAVAAGDAVLDEIAQELQFTEGPVWVPGKNGGKGYLLFSDIPADRIYRWAKGDTLEVWKTPSGQSNGLHLDGKGGLLACEHWNRRVSVYSLESRNSTTLCSGYRGGALNSPNDLTIAGDGSFWFTDPPYGLGNRKKEQPADFVFRLSPGSAEPRAMVADFDRPNGIVFSPDKKILYISDSGKPHQVRSFRVTGDTLVEKGVFTVISPGGPDGMCVDSAGRLYVTAGDGVQVFSPEGNLLGKILTHYQPTNCCFGGEDWKTLFITARPSVYAIKLKVKGLP